MVRYLKISSMLVPVSPQGFLQLLANGSLKSARWSGTQIDERTRKLLGPPVTGISDAAANKRHTGNAPQHLSDCPAVVRPMQ